MEQQKAAQPLYSIGEIAEKTGVSRRTVHYYVQRGLVPPPVGRGRGSGYTEQHAERILQVLRLQREGLSLDTIQQLPPGTEATAALAAARQPPAVVVRLAVIPGVRLELDAGASLPSPAVVDALAEACARILKQQPDSGGEPHG